MIKLMVEEEKVWSRFAAAALTNMLDAYPANEDDGGKTAVLMAATIADYMLEEFRERARTYGR